MAGGRDRLRLPPAAGALGPLFVAEAHPLARRTAPGESVALLRPMRLFHGSDLYPALLFVAGAAVPFTR